MSIFTRFIRRFLGFLILFTVCLIAGNLILKSFIPLDKRTRHEQFLQQKIAQVKHFSAEELNQIPEPAQPDMATLQDFFMTLDPALGYVPHERLAKAYQETRDQQANTRFKNATALQWTGTSSNIGGRTRAIMWDPNDPTGKKVWAGSVSGGLWYRNNITSNLSEWQPVNDFWSSLNISSITYDPNNPMTFYVGTGEGQTALIIYRESSGIGDGIWKSIDGGITWSLLESTLGFEYTTDIRVRNEGGVSVIYAGVTSGIYKGTLHQSEPSDGLFRSEDGGLSWEQVLPDIPGYGEPYSVADIEIGADGRLYVGTMPNVDVKGGATILYTDDGKPGSWTVCDDYIGIIQSDPIYNIPGRVILSCAPSNQNVVYAAIAAGYIDGFKLYRGRYILKSSNKGASWSQKNIPEPEWAKIAWHAMIIKVAPNNSAHIFIGGKDMWKSDNSGSDWSRISDWTLMYSGGGDDYLHCDHHAIEFKPGSSDIFITSSDGGVFYTSNATNDTPVFVEKNQGYNTLQFYTCDIYPLSGSSMSLGGLQDNGTLLYQNAPLSINNMIDKGDGTFCAFDKNELNMWITSRYYNKYTIFVNGNNYYFMDYNSGIFINPADYDSECNILYANGVDFFGGTPNTILRVKGIPFNPVGEFINLPTGTNVYFSHLKVSPWSPTGTTNLFIGTQTGRVYKVINAHASPFVIEITYDEFPAAYVSCIAVGQTEGHLLVTFSNYGVGSVWLTSDGGLTWRNIEGNLPDIPVRWAIFHPDNDNQALLATELGVWSSTGLFDNEVSWVQEINGMANVRVDMLQLRQSDNTVLAATHGRGFFTTQYLPDPFISVSEKETAKLSVYPNPSDGLINVRIPEANSGNVKIRVVDASGREVYTTNADAGNQNLQINLSSQPKGNYIVKMILDGKLHSEKVVVK